MGSAPDPAVAEIDMPTPEGDGESPTVARSGVNQTEPGVDVALDGDDRPRALFRDLVQGTIVDGKYEVDNVLGEGAMGVVVAARHTELGERVALKFLRVEHDDKDFRSRFRREAKVCAKLKNEHITRVLDVGTWRDGAMFMVMEHLAGTDLRTLLKKSGPLEVPLAIDFAVQVCEGLAEAHAQGIVHRDLKPSNLFVTKRPDGTDLIKILDFGISKWNLESDADDELTKTGTVLGSPKYMAPEQLLGCNTVDMRADVWSIGAIVYEMLSGKPPYEQASFAMLCAALANGKAPRPIREHRPDLPEALETAVMNCLQHDLDQRTMSVADLAGQLLEAVGAPFAEAVRNKIAGMLEGATINTTGAHAAMPNGTYSSAITMSYGSTSGSLRGSQSGRGVVAQPPPSKKKAILGVAAVALLGLLAFSIYRATSTPAVADTKPSAPETKTTPVAATSAPATVATTVATATATSEPTATATADASAAATVAAPAGGPKKWHGGGAKAQAPQPVAPPQPTAAPPPQPTAAPPPEAPKKPVNPLEDRQ
jgi:serine/threonine-protein kinase